MWEEIQSGIVRLLSLLIQIVSHPFPSDRLWACPFPAISPITEAACLQQTVAPRAFAVLCSVFILQVLITPTPTPVPSHVAHMGHCQQHSGMYPGHLRHSQAVVLANSLENGDVSELVLGSCPHLPEEAVFPDSATVPGPSP